jgi:hypothetical protein
VWSKDGLQLHNVYAELYENLPGTVLLYACKRTLDRHVILPKAKFALAYWSAIWVWGGVELFFVELYMCACCVCVYVRTCMGERGGEGKGQYLGPK